MLTEDLDAGPSRTGGRASSNPTPRTWFVSDAIVALALARGVRYHVEDRVLVHGTKAIVFRD
jgi:formyltetrahydrofolate hydrolase